MASSRSKLAWRTRAERGGEGWKPARRVRSALALATRARAKPSVLRPLRPLRLRGPSLSFDFIPARDCAVGSYLRPRSSAVSAPLRPISLSFYAALRFRPLRWRVRRGHDERRWSSTPFGFGGRDLRRASCWWRGPRRVGRGGGGGRA